MFEAVNNAGTIREKDEEEQNTTENMKKFLEAVAGGDVSCAIFKGGWVEKIRGVMDNILSTK